MADLVQLDLGTIATAASRTRTIRRAFDADDGAASRAAGACGHDGLSEVVGRFASTWDRRRGEFAANLAGLGEALEGIEQAFRELDRSLTEEAP